MPKTSGCSTLAITNVLGSSVTRVADITLFMRAGPEISVAATKSFIAQLAILMQIVNSISETKYDNVLQQAHKAIEEVLLMDLSEAVTACKDAQSISMLAVGHFTGFP